MTKPASSSVRCDQIISIIDECLGAIAGERHDSTHTRTPARRTETTRS